MKLRLFFALVSLQFSSFLCAQNSLEKVVQQLQNLPDYKSASIGICIKDIESGAIYFEFNADKLFIPASTLKLLTTASALEILGENYRFETKLGYIGETEKNLLKGNLVIIGGADPTLGSRYFQNSNFEFLKNWARQIKLKGITKITGDLILDASIYDSEKIPATWIWEDIGNYYGAGANAFTVYDNLFEITFKSPKRANKPTKIISLNPNLEGIEIRNRVRSSDKNRDNAYVYGSPLDKTREIRGTIPKNRKSFTIKAAIYHPEELLAKELIMELAKEGVFVKGGIKFEKIKQKNFHELYSQQSPLLSEIVEVTNHKSINLFSEHLLKQISVGKNGLGNREAGVEIIKEYWQSKGIRSENIFMEDGSGLSHFNAVSPSFFVQLLVEMKNNQVFVNSLPTAGEGTIYQFSQQDFPQKTLLAKSGSMTRVRCYAGYINTNAGSKLAFSIMVNHFAGSHSNLIKEIEKILVEIKK